MNPSCALQEINQNFKLFDIDGDAILPDFKVSYIEFGKVLRCLGHRHDEGEIKKLFAAIDDDGGGEIGFVEFADMWTGLVHVMCMHMR